MMIISIQPCIYCVTVDAIMHVHLIYINSASSHTWQDMNIHELISIPDPHLHIVHKYLPEILHGRKSFKVGFLCFRHWGVYEKLRQCPSVVVHVRAHHAVGHWKTQSIDSPPRGMSSCSDIAHSLHIPGRQTF